MQNHIIFFSGGKSSFSVADYVKENYPNDNILLYFTDTLWEDEDLYRFIHEASDKLELPMLIHSRGITPAQLMVQQRFMANN
jgi:3'-phosphoadenosine 5'-phosphosulfate sulfotransferase (PAPS reductase)/FAD synthetase